MSSLATYTVLSPSTSSNVFAVFVKSCGATYKIIGSPVLAHFDKIDTLSDDFSGKNPKNVNPLAFIPLSATAVARAVGPGTVSTSTPCEWHFAITSAPGSLMEGMPASVIIATFCPLFIISIRRSEQSCSLNL